MKKLFLLSLFVSCHIFVFSQDWSVEYSFGYAAYKLDDVKTIQTSLQQHMSQYGAKTTENFPAWFTHNGAIGYIANRSHFGINFSYFTTGARTGVTDYSGSYYTNTIMNGYRLGAFYRYYINTGLSALKLYIQASPGAIFSKMKMTESITIATESDSYTEKMKSTVAFIEPAIGVKYHVTNWMNVSFRGGYEFDFGGKLKNAASEKSSLKTHWDGLRMYVGVGLTIPNI